MMPNVELEDVFRTHQRAVFSYFYRVCGNYHQAEELTQETFARACAAAVRYRGDGPISHWLFAIARRVLMQASRRGLFEQPRELDQNLPAPEVDHEAAWTWNAASPCWRRSTEKPWCSWTSLSSRLPRRPRSPASRMGLSACACTGRAADYAISWRNDE